MRRRGHWGAIENGLHWVRDVTFNEDASTLRAGTAPHTMAIIRNTLINAFRLSGWTNLKQARRHFSHVIDRAIDLQWTPVIAPTFADYLPLVIAAAGPGARRTYGTYWDRILVEFAGRRLDEITVTDIEILMRQVMAAPVIRRNARDGVYAGEHLVAGLRTIYTRAVADRLLPPHHNPAASVPKPRRPASNRRALSNPCEDE